MELLEKVACCLIEGQLPEFRPKIDLVASRVAAEAAVDVALKIDRERAFACLCQWVVWQRAESAPLIAADDQRLVVDAFQDAAN